MNTKPTPPAQQPTPSKPVQSQSPPQTSAPTPPSPPGTQQTTMAPSPETAEAPQHTSVPESAPTPPNTATSTHTDTPVATVAPSQPLPPQERDVSQGVKAGGSTVHPVTGKSSQEYILRGNEILDIVSNKFQIDTKTGVTELRWDEANQCLRVKHSPA